MVLSLWHGLVKTNFGCNYLCIFVYSRNTSVKWRPRSSLIKGRVMIKWGFIVKNLFIILSDVNNNKTSLMNNERNVKNVFFSQHNTKKSILFLFCAQTYLLWISQIKLFIYGPLSAFLLSRKMLHCRKK